MSDNKNKIDELLYSRQIYSVGYEATKKLSESTVLISGISGPTIEIAKCIILSGIKRLILHDATGKNIEEHELDTLYYFSKKDIGKSRLNCVDQLRELNDQLELIPINGDKNIIHILAKYKISVCVVVNYKLDAAIKVDDYARSQNIPFLSANTYGGFGNIFVDFGNDYTVADTTGEDIKEGIILETKNNEGKILYTCASPHGLSGGDSIQINDGIIIDVYRAKDPYKFYSHQEIQLNASATFTQIKKPRTFNFKSMSESVLSKKLDITTGDLTDMPDKLHQLYLQINSAGDDKYTKDTPKLQKLLNISDSQLIPVTTVIGSMTATEIIKACTKKFCPIYQWFYYDISEIIPDIKTKTINQNKIFDSTLLNDANVFIVGMGAIGCEHLKNMAMMGIKNITITDMDHIERSNLSRQFLFRNGDIGKSKSLVAKGAILRMRPDMKIIAHQNKICSDTLNIYDEKFFKSMTCIAGALDNIPARLFVDSQCVIHDVPLIESGTLGMKANTQSIIPHLTKSYGSTSDPAEDNIPVCTIKSFPYMIEHTIQYGKEIFNEFFTNYTTRDKPTSYDDCIFFAVQKWHELFKFQIEKLLSEHPEKEFWTGAKKMPSVAKFDVNDKYTFMFVESAANIWAKLNDIKQRENKYITKYCTSSFDIKPCEESGPKSEPKIKGIEFEKDDPANYHVEFIASVANLRAYNYGIKNIDKLQVKKIAGKIIPAMATTTSLVSGLVCAELYKVIMKKSKVEEYRDWFINLSMPYISSTEPQKAKQIKVGSGDMKYTMWDSITLKNPTVGDIIKYVDEIYDTDLVCIMYGQVTLYDEMDGGKIVDEKIIDIFRKHVATGAIPPPIVISLFGQEEELPRCKIYF